MNPAKLGRGVWQKIFELLTFRNQVRFRSISRYFLQFNIVYISTFYIAIRYDFSLFPHADREFIMKKNISLLGVPESLTLCFEYHNR